MMSSNETAGSMFDFIFSEPEGEGCGYVYPAHDEGNPYLPFITDLSQSNRAVNGDLLNYAGPSQRRAGVEVCAPDASAFRGYPDFQVFPDHSDLPGCADFSGRAEFPGYSDFPSLSGMPKSLLYPTKGLPGEGELHCT